jgi:Cu/Ag efflux protein CusF
LRKDSAGATISGKIDGRRRMRIRPVIWALTTMLLAGGVPLAEEATSGVFSGHGVVTAVQSQTGALTIKHDDIKGFMPAMEMMYKVKAPDLSRDVRPGDVIDFKIDAAKYEILELTVVGRGK